MRQDPTRLCCTWRIWEHSRLRGSEDRPKPRWASANVLGVAWGADCSSHQPLYEWALFHALSHEAQRTVAWVCAYCPCWHPQPLCTAISGHPGEICQWLESIFFIWDWFLGFSFVTPAIFTSHHTTEFQEKRYVSWRNVLSVLSPLSSIFLTLPKLKNWSRLIEGISIWLILHVLNHTLHG